ncbi:MacS family sensor histidine kinase [Goodfellowiella coeruleoviolacea]|uniref:Signal transduction histidine kinase n=1 Tax=Goodfellowiella coeruleoviolacea TaxID=334858 RepID=A0AAE3GK68_9PSEU|nr:DUF5931 domain-containing protein [Goodfellowiella coeruleoviolacea]MCP2168927.1 Signal transduction histidine kinase [Goodfellowiella coeruleoviolacea]
MQQRFTVPGNDRVQDPTTPLWRGTGVLRIVTFLFAVGVTWVNHTGYTRPWLAWVTVTAMGGWTAFTVWAYSQGFGRRPWVVVADVVVTCALMGLSPLILSDTQYAWRTPLITTIWAAEPPVAAGTLAGRYAGMVAGGVVALCTYLSLGRLDVDVLRDAALLMGAGFVVGLAAQVARQSAEQLARALRTEAATAERERLARSIHDGVLQVLARVQRRGAELGGEAAELAALAGEQEMALRALVSAAPAESTVDGEVDLRPELQLLATHRVQVAAPATRVMVAARTATELTAIAREALSNVDKHAGPDARAWVLLEDLGDEVVLSIRDDGPGIPSGRLAVAEAEGRMGVAKSMRGRVVALGGRLDLQTGPGEGTEWEVRVPRAPSRD